MAETRGRRPRRRRKVCFEEVLPSTDLPPLVQGDLRCFLVVDIGKILWSTTATAQVPPASPAYVRLRWWGETSDGTLFKPCSAKNSERSVKCRCRFGVRSGAKQMSAYFVDMGSIMFEVLTSPKSVPLGHIQIPKVAHLSSSNPIRDYFPIISPSSRKVGEIEIHIRFKSLEAAYDLTTDTGTDTSMSSRSMPPSEIGRKSRSRGSSVGSRASARSRSSSAGSRKSQRRKRSKSSSTKQRRRSQSTESNASSASKRSHSIKKGSTIGSSTPRGIDELLQKNGQDLYSMNSKPPRKSSLKSGERSDSESQKDVEKVSSDPQQDAISILLQRGSQLREDILKSQLNTNAANPQTLDGIQQEGKISQPVSADVQGYANERIVVPINPQPILVKAPLPQEPKVVTPIKAKKQNLDMRFVDLVFGSHEFSRGQMPFLTDSRSASPLSSMISEIEDNPLFDESLLHQMFYNNDALFSYFDAQKLCCKMKKNDKTNGDDNKPTERKISKPISVASRDEKLAQYLMNEIPGITLQDIAILQRVYCIKVIIETLAVYRQNDILMTKPRAKKGRGRGGKPPVPSPKLSKSGTYFIEFRFPDATHSEREHPSSMTTSHDVTRVVSRKTPSANAGIAIFDECCEFPYKFTEENILKWGREEIEFIAYQKRPTDKKATVLGTATVCLCDILTSHGTEIDFDLDMQENNQSKANLKVSFSMLTRPEPPTTSQENEPETEKEKQDKAAEVTVPTKPDHQNGEVIQNSHGPSIVISSPSSLLYMMVIVTEGIEIPGTTITTPNGQKFHPPNVSLVCRTLTPGESDKTPVIWGQSNPKFDFVQVSPLKVDGDLIMRMKNNFVVVEVWIKIAATVPPSDKLLGLAKLPTHHFYQSLKDEEISKVVLSSLHPLISVDEPVPVIDLFSGQERGHLQVTLALGTQTQISTLRKVKSDIQGRRIQQHHLEEKEKTKMCKLAGPVRHNFGVKIVKLKNFKPPQNEVWGETDCFIQYLFPTQRDSCAKDCSFDGNGEVSKLDLASMQTYRSEATLCIPNPAFNDARQHVFAPPPSIPVQRILLSCCYSDGMPGGIPFELWSRYYHPNVRDKLLAKIVRSLVLSLTATSRKALVCMFSLWKAWPMLNVRDKLLAKGTLPMAKIGALVTMCSKDVSEQTFCVPMEFVDPELSDESTAGQLEVAIKYKSSETTSESMQPPMKFSKPVILKVGIIRASGLKAAAASVCRSIQYEDLKYCADVGVNTYVELKPSFLPDEDVRISRVVAQSFAPEYQHHVEIACPLISYHRDITPISLAELLLSGDMEITIWHRCEDSEDSARDDIALARLTVPMRSLLHKTTGMHGWHLLTACEQRRKSDESTVTVGGLELSMSFSHTNDLDLILKAAKATGWSLPPFESRLLNEDIRSSDVTGPDHVTFSITVTNAWLMKNDLLLHGRKIIDKNANVYVRYKFFDHDSVTTSLCPLTSKQPHSIDARFENLTSARLAHKKSFVCKKSRPLHWYLREEKMEVQVWLTHSNLSKKSRPLDSDKLLGSCYIEFSSISEWDKEQHISGSFHMFKAGSDDLGGGQVRVYVSMKQGEIADPIPDPPPITMSSDEEDNFENAPNQDDDNSMPAAKETNDMVFRATITVERVFHLPLVGDLETDKLTPPNAFVSFDVVDETVSGRSVEDLKMVTLTTRLVKSSENSVWNEAREVSLPRNLLTGSHGALLLKVWHRDRLYFTESSTNSTNPGPNGIMATDRMLGFATVDLSVLRAGFRDINGWYNVLDIHGQCQGQLKVAVTPTRSNDSSQPNSARSNDPATILPPSASPPLVSIPPNFLHKVPIDVPVQTPSGSMYMPGIQGPSLASSDNYKSNSIEADGRTTTEAPAQRFLSDFSRFNNPSHAPTTSMFRYVTSDRQQATLVSTLERQIKELENIKLKFEERKRQKFQGTQCENGNSRSADCRVEYDGVHHEKSGNPNVSSQNGECVSSEQPEQLSYKVLNDLPRSNDGNVGGETLLKLHPNMTDSCDALPNLEVSSKNRHPSISSLSGSDIGKTEFPTAPDHAQQKSVHLSLYQPQKDSQLKHDRLMSDNEVSSDIEFVQPQDLNAFSSEINGRNAADDGSKILEKPPHSEPKHHDRVPDHAVLGTPVRSDVHSALDDTSLWLTGSTLRVSGFSSGDENDGEAIDEDGPDGVHTGNHDAESCSSVTPDVFVTPLRRRSHHSDAEKESPRSFDEQELLHPGAPLENHMEPAEETSPKRFDGESELPPSPAPVLPVPSGFKEDVAPNTQSEASSSDESKVMRTTTSEENHANNNSCGESNGLQDMENKTHPVSENLSATSSSKHEDSSSTKSQNDENCCPNSVNLSRKQIRDKKEDHSFYPPTQNFETSIRALQEATLKHKRELLKRNGNVDSNIVNSKDLQKTSNHTAKPKVKNPAPKQMTFSDEKTQRLARIFRTKFSS